MAVDLVAAILFPIVVIVELCWEAKIALQHIPIDLGRKLTLPAAKFIIHFLNAWTFIGVMLFILRIMSEDSKSWCFLLFILINYYEMFAFFDLLRLRKQEQIQADAKRAELQADPKRAKLQTEPEGANKIQADSKRAELQADPKRAFVTVAIVG